MPENLQIILRFFSFFSDFLGFSSYLCTRKSAARKKRLRCYNLYKSIKKR